MDRLPSLNALRAFEAAARHLSFTRAARELHVTQSAVSHQVRRLEEELSCELFVRLPRRLRLTPQGEHLARTAGEAFGVLARGARLVARRRSLCVSVLPSFAARWLLPRIGRFRRQNPGIDLRIDASQELADFVRDGVDLAIRYGRGVWRGVHSERLLGETVFPVCTAGLARTLRSPDDLRRCELLHDEARGAHGGWAEWLRQAGARVDARRGTSFTDANLMLQAAADGQGVALARGALAEGDLRSGRLVKPFALELPARYAYFIVTPRRGREGAEVRAFREFLRGEAQRGI